MDGQVTGLSHDLVQLSTDVKTILKLLNANLNLNEYVHFYRGSQAQAQPQPPLTQAQQDQLLHNKNTKRNTTSSVNCVKQASGPAQKSFTLESDKDSTNSILATPIRTNSGLADPSSHQRYADIVQQSLFGSTAEMTNHSFGKKVRPNSQTPEKSKCHAHLQRVNCYGQDMDENIQSAPSSAGLPPAASAACTGVLSSRSQSCDNVPDTAGEIARRRRLEPVRRGDSARFGMRPLGCGSCLTEECEVVRCPQSDCHAVAHHQYDVTSDCGLECSQSPLSSSGDSRLSGFDRTACRLSDFDDVMQQNAAEVISGTLSSCGETAAEVEAMRRTSNRGDSGIDMGKDTDLQAKISMLLTTDL